MKRVMSLVRREIALDRMMFRTFSNNGMLHREDILDKRTYIDGLTSGAFVFSGIKLHDYTVLKMYIIWEYRRLERVYFN